MITSIRALFSMFAWMEPEEQLLLTIKQWFGWIFRFQVIRNESDHKDGLAAPQLENIFELIPLRCVYTLHFNYAYPVAHLPE